MAERTGIERIAAERQRQIEAEGWTPDHDDEHEGAELARAAICYAASASEVLIYEIDNDEPGLVQFVDPWPSWWDDRWDKRPRNETTLRLKRPTKAQRIRMLEKAGALIAAEIDRLLRCAPVAAPKEGAKP